MEKRYKKVNKVEVFEKGDPVFPSGHTVPGMTLTGPDGVILVWCWARISLRGIYSPYRSALQMPGGQALDFKAGLAYSAAR